MRITAVVIGAVAALIGILKSLLSCFLWAGVGIRSGTLLANTYLRTVFASNAVLAASYVVALVGTTFVGRRRYRGGAALLLGAILGIVAAVLLYALLMAIFAVPLEPAVPAFPRSVFFYVVWLGPVPLLLIAAALSLSARREGSRTPDAP